MNLNTRQLPLFTPSRRSLRDLVRTLYMLFVLLLGLILFMLLMGPLLLLAAVTFDRRRLLARRSTRATFNLITNYLARVSRSPIRVTGEKIDWKSIGPCIVVANHGSALDALMLMHLPAGVGDGRVWAKGWPFRLPLLGWLMHLSGHLRIDDFNLLPNARDFMAGGETMLVFPESSRTRTGKLGRFRDGAFLLAVRTGRPIVPVAIHGTFDCFRPGQWWIKYPRIRIEVLGVLQPGKDARAHLALKRQAHAMIASSVEGLSAPSTLPLAAAS